MRRFSAVLALCAGVAMGAVWGDPAEKNRKPFTFYVEVLDEKGQPASDVDVQCVPLQYNAPLPTQAPSEAQRGKTGPDGTCAFKNLTDMSLIVYAVKGDTYAINDPIFLDDGTHDVRMKLAPGRRAFGFVHTEDGTPLEGVRVLWKQNLILTESDAQGLFSAPELDQISFSKPGYGYMRSSHFWGDYDLRMVPETVVEGTVQLEDGTPVEGARVFFIDDVVTTDNKGFFRATGLTEGHEIHFNFHYESEGQRWVNKSEIVIDPPPSQQVTIKLKKFVPPPQARRVPATGDVVFASWPSAPETPLRNRPAAETPLRLAQASPAAAPSPCKVTGEVVDEQGQPVSSVDVHYENAKRERTWFQADGRGHFEDTFKSPGEWTVDRVGRLLTFQRGPNESEIEQEQPVMQVLEGGAVTVPADGSPISVRIVVKRPLPLNDEIRGVMQDADGKPLTPKITVFSKGWKPTRMFEQEGVFALSPSLNTPGILLFVLPGYKPRLLEIGRDFKAGDRDVKVSLEKGPFKTDESVWTAVTGRPDTEAATQEQYEGQYLRGRLDEFRELATPAEAVPAPEANAASAAPQEVVKLKLVVSDPQGKPVPAIKVQAARPIGNIKPKMLRQDNATADPNAAPETLNNEKGEYEVASGVMVGAPGTAPALVNELSAADLTGRIPITLGPPGALTLHVLDQVEMKPLEGAVVVAAGDISELSDPEFAGYPRTDAQGNVTLEGLPAGEYLFLVHSPGPKLLPPKERLRPFVAVQMGWGEKVERTHVVERYVAGSTESLMRSLIHDGSFQEMDRSDFDAKDLEALERFIVEGLQDMPYLEPATAWSLWRFSKVACMLDFKATADIFRDRLLRPAPRRSPEDPFPETAMAGAGLLNTVAKLQGDDALDFLTGFATSEQQCYPMRIAAYTILQTMGTEKSLKVFQALRDAALSKPGMPPRREQYTHAQKMNETYYVSVYGIPGLSPETIAPPDPEGEFREAWVSPDYSEGRIEGGRSPILFKRFGDEWLIYAPSKPHRFP